MTNDKKETAVDYLIKNIEIALKLNGVKLNHMYRMKTVYPLYSQAKAMEREQIIESIILTIVGSNEIYDKEYPEVRQVAEQYYNETYGDDK
jgi:hypothetical protein